MPEPRPLQLGGARLQKDTAPAAPAFPAMGARMDTPPMAPDYGAPAVRASTAVAPARLASIPVDKLIDVGSATMAKSASVSKRINSSAKASDIDELGKGLTTLMGAARDYDPSRWNKGLIGGLFRKTAKQLDAHFKSIDQNVNSLSGVCTKQLDLFARRKTDIAQMSQENMACHAQLVADIADLEAAIAYYEANPPQVDASDPMSAQTRARFDTAIAFAKKHASDLADHKLMCELDAPQIDTLNDNGQLLTMKFNSILQLLIPALQRKYAQYVLAMEQGKAVALADAADVALRDALIQGAKKNHENAVAINTAMARQAITTETLTAVHKEVMDTFDDVAKIRTEMVAAITAKAPEREALSRQLAARQAQGSY